MAVTIVNPRPVQTAATVAESPRLDSLRGKSIAFLNNRKLNSPVLLEELARILVRDEGVGRVDHFDKESWTRAVPDDTVEELATFDAVVTGVGDCGSCSSGTLMDVVVLERRGIPTAAICTEPFRGTVSTLAEGLGMPNARLVFMSHPFGSLPADDVRSLALKHRDDVISIITN
jgi:hypothetical protein